MDLDPFNDATWERANLPHGLEILPENASGGRNYQGPAWYRKRFSSPSGTGKAPAQSGRFSISKP